MLKNLIILVTMIFMAKAYSQIKPAYLAGTEANSSGLFEIANLKCMGEECIADGQTFMLPFTVEIEGSINSINLANAEIYLASVARNEFNQKLKAFDYKGGVKLFGVQSEAVGVNQNATQLLSVNVVRTEYVEYIDLSQDGKTRLVFNLYGSFGFAKMTNQFDEYSQTHLDLVNEDHGVTPENTIMNNDFGTKVDIGASITFQIQKLQIAGYARAMTHTSNNIMGGNADNNGLVNQTRLNTVQLGLDLQYNVYNFKNGGNLFLFTNIEYGRYHHSLISGMNDIDINSMPGSTKELNFKVGVRYTLPTFKRKKKKKKFAY